MLSKCIHFGELTWSTTRRGKFATISFLTAPNTGVFSLHVCGLIDEFVLLCCRWSFTYNQGLMIGATMFLHEITKDAKYLTGNSCVVHFVAYAVCTYVDALLYARFMCEKQVEQVC